MREGIDIEQYANFPAFSYDLKPKLDEKNAYMLDLADSFNDFVGLAQIRYNLLLSDRQNEEAVRLWEDEKDNAIEYAKRVDLDAIFSLLHLNNPGLKDFLLKFKDAIIADKWETDADNAILKQEVRIKGCRAKLRNKSKYPQDKWIGGYRLDYRFTDARRIIMDIRNAEEHV